VWSVFQERPLPGDLVIRRRFEQAHSGGYVVTYWPDAETVVAGPYSNYADALSQARVLLEDRYGYIWCDNAHMGEPERLDRVGGSEPA
jgi:hypothetical protein